MQVNVPRAMGLRSQEGASIVDLTSTTPTIPKPARAEFILFRTENRTPRPSAPLGMARPISPQGSCYDCAPFNGVLCQMMKITVTLFALVTIFHAAPAATAATPNIAQSLEQMRKAIPLTLDSPPLKSPIFVPVCSRADEKMTCPWKAFQHTIESATDP